MLGIPGTGTQTTGKGWQIAVRISNGTGKNREKARQQ